MQPLLDDLYNLFKGGADNGQEIRYGWLKERFVHILVPGELSQFIALSKTDERCAIERCAFSGKSDLCLCFSGTESVLLHCTESH